MNRRSSYLRAELIKPKRIIVEVKGGLVTAVYGDNVPCDVDLIVRDMDNIAAGDPDPLEGETVENPRYYY